MNPENVFKVTRDGLVPVEAANRNPRACHSKTDEDPKPEEVEQARRYLGTTWVPSKTSTRGSYGLKHEAEHFGFKAPERGYVSNGALIAAALSLGFRVEPDGGGINADIFVKAKR